MLINLSFCKLTANLMWTKWQGASKWKIAYTFILCHLSIILYRCSYCYAWMYRLFSYEAQCIRVNLNMFWLWTSSRRFVLFFISFVSHADLFAKWFFTLFCSTCIKSIQISFIWANESEKEIQYLHIFFDSYQFFIWYNGFSSNIRCSSYTCA